MVMQHNALPPRDEMYAALLNRDASFEGLFVFGVRTTGIFCRPTCPARKPAEKNVSYFVNTADALFAGFQPCKRCYPMEPVGAVPDWLRGLIKALESDPSRRWQDQDLRDLGLEPTRVRRWFKQHHDMTFHAFQRARRLGMALGQLSLGGDIPQTAFAAGFESVSGFHDAIKRICGGAPGQARDATVVYLTRIPTPLGPMVIGATETALCLLEFADRSMLETQLKRIRKVLGAVVVPGETAITRLAAEEIDAYFDGSLREFSVPLELSGTDFQRQVWQELETIPFGVTRSYREQAQRINRPSAVRAVAGANGDNRISIIIPCHRVIGADGTLTGYGGGLWRKHWLLEHEGVELTEGVVVKESGNPTHEPLE
jgi:AraC family transcriptional regulator of adaptative response/methylated-DNA-[protein]-cysteine methyltransferase